MTLIASKIAQYIRPDSITNSDAAVYRTVPVLINASSGIVKFANASDTITNFATGEITLEIEYYNA